MKIYSNQGIVLLDIQVDDTSVRYRSIMQDDSLTLKFSHTTTATVPVGSYVEFEGQRYTLWLPENFKKHNTRNFEYTLTLGGWREALKLFKFKDLSAMPYRLKFSLTAKPKDFLQLIVDNMNVGDSGWLIGSYIDAPEKTISFKHEYVFEAINRIAQEFTTEWEIENKTIHLRKVEKFKDAPLALSYGKGNGFKSGVGRANDGDNQPIGRLYVQGGERNIDFSTYGSTSLLLPKSATLVHDGKTYRADAHGMYITRDGNNLLAEDSFNANHIYPKRVGTVSAVVLVDAEKHFYDIKDASIPELLDYSECRIEGEKATISFQSGALAGREFDIEQTDKALTGYIHAERRFKIVPQELDGVVMPSGVFVPKVGDKYAIFNISMPASYISDNPTKTGASWEMLRECVKYFAENEKQKFNFTGELDGIWAKSKWLEIGGKIVPGGHINFSDTQFLPDGEVVRIISVKDYVNFPHKPEITLSNAPVSGGFNSTLGKLEAEEVVIEGNRKEGLQYSKRQWRDTRETMSMLEESLLKFSSGINPITIQTMQLIAGDESLQFRFVNNKTAPTQVPHNVVFSGSNKKLIAGAGIIQHMTLGISALKKSHSASEYKYWSISPYTSPPLDADNGFFLYAKVSKSNETGTFVLSETAVDMEGVAGYYHLLLGILNSEFGNDRSYSSLYGFTEILPGRITTDRIVSQDGKTYFDLANSRIVGKISFLSSGESVDMGQYSDQLEQSISDTNGKIDNLEIGGQNLLDGTSDGWTSITTRANSPYVDNFFKTTLLEAGQTYTFSWETELVSGVIPAANQISVGSGTTTYQRDIEYSSLGTVIGKHSLTFKPSTADLVSHKSFAFRWYNNNAVFTFKYRKLQLEKGSKGTDWGRSTDDINKAVADAKKAGADAQTTATNANTAIGALADSIGDLEVGLINGSTLALLEEQLRVVKLERTNANSAFTALDGNAYLVGTAKTNLSTRKNNFNSSVSAIATALEDAIFDKILDQDELDIIDAALNGYGISYTAYQNAIEEARKAIDIELKRLADKKVDDLEVGGRNLLIGSTDTWVTVNARSSDVHIHNLFPETKLEVGQEYVFSWETELLSGSPTYVPKVTLGAGVTSYVKDIKWLNNPLIGKQFNIFRPTGANLSSGNAFMMRWYTANETFSFRYRKLKLEKGNKPSADWTESQEDTAAKINAAQAKADKSAAITDKLATTIDGGLLSTIIIYLRDLASAIETAGLSGIQGLLKDNPAFWAGGSHADALAVTSFLRKIANNETPGVGEYAALAKIAMLHSGGGKFGDFIVEDSGRIIMVDPTTAKRRLVFSIEDIPLIDSLVSGVSSTGTTTIGSGNTNTIQSLSGSANITQAGGSITIGAMALSVSGGGKNDHFGRSSFIGAKLTLYRGSTMVRTIWTSSVFFTGDNYYQDSMTRNFNETTFAVSAKGVYTLKLEVERLGDISAANGASTSFPLSWDASLQGVKRQEYGKNGMMFFYSDNHFHFTEFGGLDVRGKTNMPGVLLSTTVSSTGIFANTWGAKKHASLSASKVSTGTYDIYHSIGHGIYNISANAYGNRTISIVSKSADRCRIQIYNGTTLIDGQFDITLTGNNY